MTLEEYIAYEKKRLQTILESERPLYLAAQSALVEFSERVFVRGQDISGGQFIYDYKTPIYVNPVTSPGTGFKPEGKPTVKIISRGKNKGQTRVVRNKKKFVNEPFQGFGNKVEVDRKTKWFPSYMAYRREIGYEYSFVNWELSGELKLDIENRSSGEVSPRKVNSNEFIIGVTEKNRVKLYGKSGTGGLNRKYGDTFKLSKNEIEVFNNVYDKELLRIFRQYRP